MRTDRPRLDDVIAAADAIAAHMARGGLDDGLVFDAVRVRLIEIGEAVKDIDPALLAQSTTTSPRWSTLSSACGRPPLSSRKPRLGLLADRNGASSDGGLDEVAAESRIELRAPIISRWSFADA